MASRKEQIDTNVTTRRGRNRSSVESNDQPGASVNMDELRELIALLQDNGLAELELERNNFRVRLRREGSFVSAPYNPESAPTSANRSASATAPTTTSSPAHPGAQAETAASGKSDLHYSSPIVGTYRSPSPNADPFVRSVAVLRRKQSFVSSSDEVNE
jgi:acetyl-CoA carboxylase biotin carboxyl carrier protein